MTAPYHPTPEDTREHVVHVAIGNLIEDGNAIELEDAFKRIVQVFCDRKLYGTAWKLHSFLGNELRAHRKDAIERGEAA